MVRILIVGFGFMGRMHAQSLNSIAEASVVGVVDLRGDEILPAVREMLPDCRRVCTTLEEGLAECPSEAVLLCIPTDLHRQAAETVFHSRRHVFCEKPIALTQEEGAAMIAAGRKAGCQLMIGHCIRFWPEYEALREMCQSNRFGRLLSLQLSRRNQRPRYAVSGWVDDPSRCTGAALDMHIHDTDFLCSLLGRPRSVTARGVRETSGWNSIATLYDYGETPLVAADASWMYPDNWAFRMSFSAVFENAALDYDSASSPSLVLTAEGRSPRLLPLPGQFSDGYETELRYFVDCVEHRRAVEKSHGEDALRSLEVTLAEIESASAGGTPVALPA